MKPTSSVGAARSLRATLPRPLTSSPIPRLIAFVLLAAVTFTAFGQTPAPTITVVRQPQSELQKGTPAVIEYQVTSRDGADVIVTASSSNEWLIPQTNLDLIRDNQRVSLIATPLTNRAGRVHLTLRAHVPGGPTNQVPVTLVYGPDQPTELDPIPDQHIREDTPLTVPITLRDPDSDTAGYRLRITAPREVFPANTAESKVRAGFSSA
jgi:hypothetical protein